MQGILKTYRVLHWPHFLGFVVLGAFASSPASALRMGIALVSAALLLAYAYSFNDFFDKKKKGFFPFIPLLLFAPLIRFLDANQILFSLTFVVIVTLYSLPFPRLKAIPVIGTLSNSAGFSLLFLLGATLPLSTVAWVVLVILFLLETVAQLIHECADSKEDAKDRACTTARALGKKNTRLISRALLICAIGASLFMPFGLGFYFVSIPAIIFSSIFLVRISIPDTALLRADYRRIGIVCGLFFLAGLLIIRVT